MWRKTLAAALLLAAASTSEALAADWRQMKQFADQATCSEHQDRWRAINWYSDFAAAQQQAIQQDKPILVFMVVQHRGNKSATDC